MEPNDILCLIIAIIGGCMMGLGLILGEKDRYEWEFKAQEDIERLRHGLPLLDNEKEK